MEGDLIAGYGADCQWHLWVGKTGGGAVRKALTVDGRAGECVVPPSSWEELQLLSHPAGTEGWLLEDRWNNKVAFVVAYEVVVRFFPEEFTPTPAAEQAHRLWWLGEGGRARVVRLDDAHQFFLEVARRGRWGQLALPEMD